MNIACIGTRVDAQSLLEDDRLSQPTIIGDGVIPEAECMRDVQQALRGHPDVVLLAHVAGALKQQISDGSTIYNLEPLFDGCRSLTLGYLDVLRRFNVWDYQARNVEFLERHGIKATHVPYRYTPGLERAPSRTKDIDALFVGSMTPRRRSALNRVAARCRVVEVQGCYGRRLDALIARARIVLNVHYCDGPHPLEVVRLNYLMANRCFVISERGWDDEENEQYEGGLVFSDDLASTCAKWLKRDRVPIEAAAQNVIRNMPMKVPQ